MSHRRYQEVWYEPNTETTWPVNIRIWAGLTLTDLFEYLGPSCNRFGRDCYIKRNNWQENLIVEYEERTVQKQDSDLTNENRSQFGLRNDCILNELHNFHIIENKTFDIMHDLLEGE